MNVSLPETLKRFVDGKVASGTYGSASEFVQEAIREKRSRERDLRKARKVLESKLIEGLESGEPIVYTPAYIAKKKADLRARLNRTKQHSTKLDRNAKPARKKSA